MTYHQALSLLDDLPFALHNHEAVKSLKLTAITTLSDGIQFLYDQAGGAENEHRERFIKEFSDSHDDIKDKEHVRQLSSKGADTVAKYLGPIGDLFDQGKVSYSVLTAGYSDALPLKDHARVRKTVILLTFFYVRRRLF